MGKESNMDIISSTSIIDKSIETLKDMLSRPTIDRTVQTLQGFV